MPACHLILIKKIIKINRSIIRMHIKEFIFTTTDTRRLRPITLTDFCKD